MSNKYNKQILHMIHDNNHTKVYNNIFTKDINNFTKLNVTPNNITLYPGIYVININGSNYIFLVFSEVSGTVYLVNSNTIRIGSTYFAIYKYNDIPEDGVISNTVNTSADYVAITGKSILSLPTGNIQSPYNAAMIDMIENISYILKGPSDDKYDENTIGFTKRLKSLNSNIRDLMLIDTNLRNALLINKVGIHQFTGNEDWKLYSDDGDNYIFYLDMIRDMSKTSKYIICNYFPTKEFNKFSESDYCIGINDNKIYIKILKSLIEYDREFPQIKFKYYLRSKFFNKEEDSNPVSVLYELNEYQYISGKVSDSYDFKLFYNSTKIECDNIDNVSILCKTLREV